MKKIKVFYKNVFYAIKYIYKIDKSYIFLEFLNVILTAFSSIFSVYSLKVLLDVFLQKKINVLTIMLFIIFTISIIVDYLQNKIEKQSIELKKIIMSERTNFDLYNSILNKNVLIFEDKEYYDKIYLNMTQGLSNILSLQNNLGKLLTQILSIIGIGSIVIQYDFRIIVLVLIVVLFSVILNFYQAKLDFKKNIDSIYPSSRLCLDIRSFHQYKLILAMRGLSLKSPSQNRTCPIKAYGSSTSYSPNKHFLNISLDTPVDVSLGYLCIYSKLANMFGLCVSCFSTILLGHIYRT